MTLPYIFFAVAVTAALGNGLVQAMFAVGILLAPGFFRVTRAATLEFARAQYVEAAELLGGVEAARHPGARGAQGAADHRGDHGDRDRPGALLAVSFLTFLGIGVQPPAPTWGGVLSSDLDYLSLAPWAPFIPGALIAITVGALNALADAFRDRTGPGTLLAADPVIKTHSTLTRRSEAADDPAIRRLTQVLRPRRTCTSPCTTGPPPRVRGVSLAVHAGEIVGLVGESGSGKTLTCRAALGVLPPGCAVARGTISFAGEDVTDLSPRGWERLHGTHIGAVFQDPASYLNPNLTVGGQLAEVLRVKQRLRAPPGARARRSSCFAAVGLHQPGAGLPPDPGRAVRRHAAAGHDRHRDLLRPAAAHRRRGHHRPRRHHPGRDHRAAARTCATSAAWRCCSSPTTWR